MLEAEALGAQEGSTRAWPTADLCEEHLWRLAQAMLPPADRSATAPRVMCVPHRRVCAWNRLRKLE